MKQQYLTFEVLFALQIILRFIFPDILTWKLSLLSFLVLSALKFTYEGFRLHWFLFVLSGLLSLPNISILHFLAIIIIIFSILYFPLFENLDLTGPFRVGYKEIWLNNDTLHVSVFYPTTEKGPDSLQFSGKIPPWKDFVEIMRLSQKGNAAEWYYRIALSYLDHRKLGVNTNVPIIKEHKPFPVIVFSHGLGTHKNTYSFYLKEWASQGYIVLSAAHKDIIYPPSGQVSDFEHRNNDLKKRLGDSKEILDFVGNPNGLKKLFGGNIEIDHGKVSAIGHSYGGCTAVYLTGRDPRITGACVCMDPWYLPLEEEAFRSINKPFLTIITPVFENWNPGNKAKTMRLAKLNKEFGDQTIVCSFEGNEHNNFADNGLFMAREMSLMKALSPINLIERLFRNNASLIEAFLENTVLEKKKGAEVTRENILEKFKQKKHYPEISLVQEDFIVN